MTTAGELLREAVQVAAPVDEMSPVTLPNGDIVPFGQIIALTNGEAITWLTPLRAGS